MRPNINHKVFLNKLMLLAAVPVLVGTAVCAHADDHEIATYQFDTQVKVLSDERTRGISDSLMQPAVKLSTLFVHESGLVVLGEVVNVSKNQFLGGAVNGGAGIDVTLAGGYRFGNPDKAHFGVGLATEIFPGASFVAPHAFDFTNGPTDVQTTSYDTQFAVFEFGYGAVEGRILDVISKTYRGADTGGVCGSILQYTNDPNYTAALQCFARGDHNSQGSLLYDLDYKIDVAPLTQLALHAGYQQVANFTEANFADYRIGLTRKQWGFEWSADYVTTHTSVAELYMASNGNSVVTTANTSFVFTVSRHL
jgi:hypothetical protein